MKRKPKIDHLLDEVFRFYIKCRDDWQCQVCGAGFQVGNEWLDCSHFHRVSHKGTSCHEDNCDAFCRWCHTKLEKLKNRGQKYYNWKLRQLGEVKFEELRILAREITKLHKQDKIDLTQKFIEKIDNFKYKYVIYTEVFKKKLLAFH